MYRLLFLAIFLLSLCACGGSSANPSSTQTTTSSLASYQGRYVGATEHLDSRNSGGGAQVILDIDETGLILGRSSDTTVAMIASSAWLNANGQPQGTSIVNDYLGQQLIISYNGTINLSSEGAFDITYTYSGASSGSFRVYGTRPPIDVLVSASAYTINLGDTVTLYNVSLMPGSLYPVGDAGDLINPDQFFSWSVKSAPNGSTATFTSRNAGDVFSMPFTPDRIGTYVITLTGHNGTGTASSSDITIYVI